MSGMTAQQLAHAMADVLEEFAQAGLLKSVNIDHQFWTKTRPERLTATIRGDLNLLDFATRLQVKGAFK